jgi:hypothetical protein|nr:MAG TPA: putative internal virion protein [Caudoviricetes sp.]
MSKTSKLNTLIEIMQDKQEWEQIEQNEFNQEPTKETAWGTATISSGVPETVYAKERLRQQIAEQTLDESGLVRPLADAFFEKGGNFLGGAGYRAYMKHISDTGRDVDPNFDVTERLKTDVMLYDEEDQKFLMKAVDAQDYENRKNIIADRDMQSVRLNQLGGYGTAYRFLAGMVDLDMIFPAGKAYKYTNRIVRAKGAMKYAKTGTEMARLKTAVNIARAQRIGDTALTAAAHNAVLASAEKIRGADMDIDDIANAALSGAAMSTVLSAGSTLLGFTKDVGDFTRNKETLDTLLERNGKLTWGEKMDILDMVDTDKTNNVTTLDSVVKAKEQIYIKDIKGKVKSRKKLKEIYPDAPDYLDNIKASDDIKDIIAGSYLSNKETDAARARAYNFADENDKRMWFAQKTNEWINTVLGKPDYDIAATSGNEVFRAVAHDLVADPSNFVSNVNNAESFTDMARTRAISFFKEAEEVDYQNWLNTRVKSIKDKGELMKAKYFDSARAEFYEAVQLEINARELGIQDNLSGDPNISAYADKLVAMNDYLLDELQDTAHAGKFAVEGSQDIQKGAYLRRRWDGYRLTEAMGKYGDDSVINAFAEAIERGYGYKGLGIDPDKAKVFARAIIKNATKTDRSKKFTMSETRDELFMLLKENTDLKDEDINNLINGITQRAEERGKPNFTKYRIPMDYSVMLPDGNTVASLLDRDLHRTVTGYVNNASGRVGLARVGYTSDAKYEQMIKAAEIVDEELIKQGKYRDTKTRQYLEDFRAQLLGYPVSNDSPWANRAVGTGNLFMMNQAGLTQFVEYAPQLAAFGMRETITNSKDIIKAAIRGEDIPLIDEISMVAGNAFFDDFTVSAFNANNIDIDSIPKSSKFWNDYDYLLKKGLTKQQAWNLMKPVMLLERKCAVASLINNLYRTAKTGDFAAVRERMSDWGITDELFDKIQPYLLKDGVEIDARGKLQRVALDKWDYDTQQEFLRAVKRAMDTVVQKPRLGEQRKWLSTGMGRLIGQYKTYPLLAISKYTVRGLRHLDTETLSTMMLSMMIAPLVYISKVQLTTADEAERANKLTFDKIVYNALSYNVNLGSFVEPVNILGDLLGIKTSPYSRGTFDAAGYIAPSLNALPILASPFKAGIKLATGEELNRQTFKQLQQATIAGNMLLFSRLYEDMFGAPLTRDAKKIKRALESAKPKQEPKAEAEDTPVSKSKEPKNSKIQKASDELLSLYDKE